MAETNRRYVTESEIRTAKQMDLLTYLQTFEPNELVRDGTGYRTRAHDSLKISNGLWHWFSRGIGGKTALDYLIHVRGMDFVPAVQLLCGDRAISVPVQMPGTRKPKVFVLPPPYPDCVRATQYLLRRGISREVIARCVEDGTFYEADRYHNAVFVGRDGASVPRYAMQRSTGERALKLEVEGSDKRFSFSMSGTGDMLFVAESAIDAMSVATLMQRAGKPWRVHHYLSLGGISVKRVSDALPLALEQYLKDHPAIRRIRLTLDNDGPGHVAAQNILESLEGRYDASASFPKLGKDFNEYLQRKGNAGMER